MHTINKILFLIMMILILVVPATALKEDFTAFSKSKDLNVCACGLRQDTFSIRNTGDVTSTFLLEQNGEAAQWTNLAPQSFFLEPNEVTEVKQFINVPCYAKGTYDLNTKIKTLFGLEKEIQQNVEVGKCVNIQILQKTPTQTTCPCSPLEYEFEVVNVGQHTESYTLSVEPYPENIQLSESFLVLEPAQSKTVRAFVNLPCEVHGIQTLTLKVLAQGTKLMGESEFNININKCYDYDLFVAQGDICMNMENKLEILVDNTAEIANIYKISATGAEFATVVNNTVFAWGDSQSTTDLVLLPRDKHVGQTFNISLTSESQRGAEVRTATVETTVDNCYDSEIIQQDIAFFGVECESESFGFLLHNTGTKETTFSLSLEADEYLSLDAEENITLGSDESEEFFLDMDVPCNETGKYDFTIIAESQDFGLTHSFEGQAEVVEPEKAYSVKIEADNVDADYIDMESAFTVIHTGLIGSRYTLSVENQEGEPIHWISLDKESLTLDVGEEKEVLLKINPTEDILAESYKAIIKAIPEKADLTFSKNINVNLKSTSLVTKATDLVKQNWIYFLIAAITLLIIILIAIFARPSEDKFDEYYETESKTDAKAKEADFDEYPEKKSRLGWLIPILLLLIVGAIIGSYFLATHFIEKASEELADLEQAGDELTHAVPETAEGEIAGGVPEDALADVITEETESQPLIEVNRSQIPGKGKNIISKDGESIILPITVYNPSDRKAVYKIEVQEQGSWIQPEHTRLIVSEQGSKQTSITIRPDMDVLAENDYNVNVNINLKGEKLQYSEELDLVIQKQKSLWEQYWFWAIAGVVALLILIPIIGALRQPKDEDWEETEEPKKIKKDKKSKKELYYEDELDAVDEEKSRLGTILIILSVIVILFVALGLTVYFIRNSAETQSASSDLAQDEYTQQKTITVEESAGLESEEMTGTNVEEINIAELPLMQINREDVPGKGNKIIFKDEEAMDLILVVNNPFDTVAEFNVDEDSDWLEFEYQKVFVQARGSSDILLTITPDYEVLAENDYNLELVGTLKAGEESKTEKIGLIVSKSKGFLTSYLFYLIIGVVALIIIILFVELFKEKDDDDLEEGLGDMDDLEYPEKKSKKAKKAVKKSRKTKKSKHSKTNISLR